MSRALYKILIEDILRKISSGDIAVGERLPPEAEFAESLGVSRSTLRQAFSQLEQSGIIKRRKRGGTEVIARKPVQRYSIETSNFYDVLSLARDTLLMVTDISRVAAGTVEQLAELETTVDNWLLCSGCRYKAGQGLPFADLKIYLPEQYSDVDLRVGETAVSALVKVEERYGVAVGRIKRQISADVCSDEIAVKLGLTEGDAVLTILTQVEDAEGGLLEFVKSIVDPARYNVKTDVRVEG